MNKLELIYQNLIEYYGKQNWWPADSDIEMIVGAILVQNTNWKNVEMSLSKLSDYFDEETLRVMAIEKLELLVKSSGFYKRKAQTIQSFLNWYSIYDFDKNSLSDISTTNLRKELLLIKGIGFETADCILLYAFNRPVFVVDSYLKRLFKELNLPIFRKYDEYQNYIMNEVEKDLVVYQEYHALIILYNKKYLSNKDVNIIDPLYEFKNKITLR